MDATARLGDSHAGPPGWRALLPAGLSLEDGQWRVRHRAILVVLWVHVALLVLYGVAGWDRHVGLEAVTVAVPAVASQWLRHRRWASCAAAFGLASASAVLVHLSGGVPEMHFHYFVVVALIALYQDVAPFGVVIAYVAIQHGLFGAWAPIEVFADSGRGDPWWWAVVHAAFIAAASAVAVAGWKINENMLVRERRSAQALESIMAGAGEGIVAVDRSGVITAANQAAHSLLRSSQPLGGTPLEAVFAPEDPTLAVTDQPAATQRSTAALVRVADGSTARLDVTIAPLLVADRVDGVVLTFDDGLSRAQARAELRRAQSEVADQRARVVALQNAIMPRLPPIPGVDLGVAYEAAAAPTGGDLYDVLILPDGCVHLAVVDVGGKGITATNAALAVTLTVRALVLEGCPLDELLERAAANLAIQQPSLLATVAIGRYDPRSGALQMVFGSHPPLIVVDARGEVGLHHAPGRGIGFPLPGGRSVAVTVPLNGRALLYTDGLIEGNRDLDEGIERVGDTIRRHLDLPAAGLAQRLVHDAVAGARHSDDVLALVLHRSAPPGADADHPE